MSSIDQHNAESEVNQRIKELACAGGQHHLLSEIESHLVEAERQTLMAVDDLGWSDQAVELLDVADRLKQLRREVHQDG